MNLIGSRQALMELFSMVKFLPHGSHFRPTAEARKKARQERLHNWTFRMRRASAARQMERFGHDGFKGEKAPLRNARKRERAA